MTNLSQHVQVFGISIYNLHKMNLQGKDFSIIKRYYLATCLLNKTLCNKMDKEIIQNINDLIKLKLHIIQSGFHWSDYSEALEENNTVEELRIAMIHSFTRMQQIDLLKQERTISEMLKVKQRQELMSLIHSTNGMIEKEQFALKIEKIYDKYSKLDNLLKEYTNTVTNGSGSIANY